MTCAPKGRGAKRRINPALPAIPLVKTMCYARFFIGTTKGPTLNWQMRVLGCGMVLIPRPRTGDLACPQTRPPHGHGAVANVARFGPVSDPCPPHCLADMARSIAAYQAKKGLVRHDLREHVVPGVLPCLRAVSAGLPFAFRQVPRRIARQRQLLPEPVIRGSRIAAIKASAFGQRRTVTTTTSSPA